MRILLSRLLIARRLRLQQAGRCKGIHHVIPACCNKRPRAALTSEQAGKPSSGSWQMIVALLHCVILQRYSFAMACGLVVTVIAIVEGRQRCLHPAARDDSLAVCKLYWKMSAGSTVSEACWARGLVKCRLHHRMRREAARTQGGGGGWEDPVVWQMLR